MKNDNPFNLPSHLMTPEAKRRAKEVADRAQGKKTAEREEAKEEDKTIMGVPQDTYSRLFDHYMSMGGERRVVLAHIREKLIEYFRCLNPRECERIKVVLNEMVRRLDPSYEEAGLLERMINEVRFEVSSESFPRQIPTYHIPRMARIGSKPWPEEIMRVSPEKCDENTRKALEFLKAEPPK